MTENTVDFVQLASQWGAENKAHAGLIFTIPKRSKRATVAYPANLITALLVFLTAPPISGKSWNWWPRSTAFG